MLACCWLAAVGAGLLKSEEILEGVSRLRLSNDIEFEEETFLALMKEAKEVGYSFGIEPICVFYFVHAWFVTVFIASDIAIQFTTN